MAHRTFGAAAVAADAGVVAAGAVAEGLWVKA